MSHLEIKIGDQMPDATIYVGISPKLKVAMYATAADEPGTFTWDEASDLARTKTSHGHDDWVLPTADELDVLFINRAAIGKFNQSGEHPVGWYWSSTSGGRNGIRVQRFSDGCRGRSLKHYLCSVRYIRRSSHADAPDACD